MSAPQPPDSAGSAAETTPAALVGVLEQRVKRWIRGLETEQFSLVNEMAQFRVDVEMIKNSLDSQEATLIELSLDLSELTATLPAPDEEFDGVGPDVDNSAAATPPPDDDGVQRPSFGQLYAWVSQQIAPLVRKSTITGEGGGIRWCREWWEHWDAVERFTALYLAHGELSESGEPLWLSAYLRDHLDPHLSTLTSPYGPFHNCLAGKHSQKVTPLGQEPPPKDSP